MKSTKNVLMTGIALAIALFASVQVTAMERTINPNLAPSEIHRLKSDIKKFNKRLKYPKEAMDTTPEMKEALGKAIEKKETMLYGNQPYTMHEIMGVTHIDIKK